MRIERTFIKRGEEISFESISIKALKCFLNASGEELIENKLETFGSIIKFTYKYKTFGITYIQEYVICEIGEEENDDEKLAKTLRIIYEKMAEDIVNNILLNN